MKKVRMLNVFTYCDTFKFCTRLRQWTIETEYKGLRFYRKEGYAEFRDNKGFIPFKNYDMI
jgi:hypothetical protein